MLFTREINTEAELFTWLVAYMQRGKKRAYPTPVVEFADLLIHKVRYGLGVQDLEDIYSDLPYITENTVLAALFQEIGYRQEQSECSTRIIAFASVLYERLCAREMTKRPTIRVASANRIAILHLGLCELLLENHTKKAYFDEVTEFGEKWLVGTKLLAEEHGITVRLKADPRQQRKKAARATPLLKAPKTRDQKFRTSAPNK